MKNKYGFLLAMICLPGLAGAQTQTRVDAGLQGNAGATSGFFETYTPVNYPAGASDWWHLLDVRHTNSANNYAMQFSGSFFDQQLFFRKTSNNPAQSWSRVITETNGKIYVKGLLATNDYTNVGQHNGQFRIINGTGSLGTRALEFALLDNGTGIIQANEGGIGYNTLLLNPVSGNVGIGTTTASEKLSVKGKIRAQEIKVETSGWADFVFAKDYQLPSLQQTEKHILVNGHLPGIPSAAEVAKDGIELGEMNKKLLQKIEELTLYLIEMKKENEAEKLENQKLQDKVAQHDKEIKSLIKH
ncbi:MAG: hypothetical protein V4594_17860 [Bacteroidota bacterium]